MGTMAVFMVVAGALLEQPPARPIPRLEVPTC